MLCSRCGKHPATTHYKSVINGKVTEEHLCASCAENLNISSFYFPNVFSSLLGESFENQEALRCEVCGSTFNDIKHSGKAGCSHCYETFRDEILPSINLIHGSTKHVKTEHKNKEKTANPIDIKKEELKKAVIEERFEDAAKLRDEIKSLEEAE